MVVDHCFFCRRVIPALPSSHTRHHLQCNEFKLWKQQREHELAMRTSNSITTSTPSSTAASPVVLATGSTEHSSKKRKSTTVAQESITAVDWNKSSVPFDQSSVASLRGSEQNMMILSQMRTDFTTRRKDDADKSSSLVAYASSINNSSNFGSATHQESELVMYTTRHQTPANACIHSITNYSTYNKSLCLSSSTKEYLAFDY